MNKFIIKKEHVKEAREKGYTSGLRSFTCLNYKYTRVTLKRLGTFSYFFEATFNYSSFWIFEDDIVRVKG